LDSIFFSGRAHFDLFFQVPGQGHGIPNDAKQRPKNNNTDASTHSPEISPVAPRTISRTAQKKKLQARQKDGSPFGE
jgi:hypothetical protein